MIMVVVTIKTLPAHDELGRCRTILVICNNAACEAVLTWRNPKEHFSSITDSTGDVCRKAMHILTKQNDKQ